MPNKNINFEDVPDSVTKPKHYHKGGIDVIGFLQEHFPKGNTQFQKVFSSEMQSNIFVATKKRTE